MYLRDWPFHLVVTSSLSSLFSHVPLSFSLSSQQTSLPYLSLLFGDAWQWRVWEEVAVHSTQDDFHRNKRARSGFGVTRYACLQGSPQRG